MQPIQYLFFTGQRMDEARGIANGLKDLSFVAWSRPGIPAGYITRERLLQNPPPPPESVIDPWIITSPFAVPPDLSASQVFGLMQQHKLPMVMVFDQVNYIGVVHWEQVAVLTRG